MSTVRLGSRVAAQLAAVALATILGFGVGIPAAEAAQGFISCASNGYRYQYCPVRTEGRVVMLREVSDGRLCRQGTGWGFDGGGVWVDRGCRAEFSYGRNHGGGSWGSAGRLTCESVSYRRHYCNADTQGRVRLDREISTGNLCRQGTGWGFDRHRIWVDRGCRGEFRFGWSDSGGGASGGSGGHDAAIAAGIVGAFALGAMIASSKQTPPAAPPQATPAPAAVAVAVKAPAWVVGSYHGYDPESGDIVQLVVSGGGRAYLRDELGGMVNEGDLRDGMVTWRNGKRSWIAREGPGVMMGDVDTSKHFYFRRDD